LGDSNMWVVFVQSANLPICDIDTYEKSIHDFWDSRHEKPKHKLLSVRIRMGRNSAMLFIGNWAAGRITSVQGMTETLDEGISVGE
jgi:hypothetical protein